MARPTGQGILKPTGRIADDFFLMVHDDLSGRPRLSRRILGIGLAGALLGELAVLGAIRIEDGSLKAVGAEPVSDQLAISVFEEVAREQPLPVRDWLDYLGQQAPERVARRLEGQGLVFFRPPRVRLPGLAGRWTPTDNNSARWSAVDVNLKIYNGSAEVHHLMLFGLTRATGMNHPSLWEVRNRLQGQAYLEQILAPLSGSPPLPELLAHTEAAVGSAVTSATS
jgi:hypothetical protein